MLKVYINLRLPSILLFYISGEIDLKCWQSSRGVISLYNLLELGLIFSKNIGAEGYCVYDIAGHRSKDRHRPLYQFEDDDGSKHGVKERQDDNAPQCQGGTFILRQYLREVRRVKEIKNSRQAHQTERSRTNCNRTHIPQETACRIGAGA